MGREADAHHISSESDRTQVTRRDGASAVRILFFTDAGFTLSFVGGGARMDRHG